MAKKIGGKGRKDKPLKKYSKPILKKHGEISSMSQKVMGSTSAG
jgi:hypothetical protein